MTNTFESCGVSNCFNPTIGFTEMESIHFPRRLCISICTDHKKLINEGGIIMDSHWYADYTDYTQQTYGYNKSL